MASELVLCSSKECSSEECVARVRSINVLQQHFKFSSFRPGQLDAILPVLHGKDGN